MIIVYKKSEKGIRMYPFEKSSYEHTRYSLDDAALERFNPEKGTGFPQKRGGLSTI